eukprot:124053-Chlamydomonas_euryale.AAC.3
MTWHGSRTRRTKRALAWLSTLKCACLPVSRPHACVCMATNVCKCMANAGRDGACMRDACMHVFSTMHAP